MSSIVSIDTRGYDISMGPGVLRVGGGGGLAGNVYINGNVGIGTANPAARLEVNGTTTSAGLITANGGINTTAITSTGTTDLAKVSARHYVEVGASIGLNLSLIDFHANSNHATDYEARIQVSGGTLNSPGTGIMSIYSGNVGIGTSSPAATLDVNGTARMYCAGLGTSGSYLNFGGFNGNYTFIDSAGTSVGLGFNINGTERMRIGSNGNVLIGSSTAGLSKFNVVTTTNNTPIAAFYGNGGVNNIYDIIASAYFAAADPPAGVIRIIDDGQYSQSFAFMTKTPGAMSNSLAERMRITPGGFVGIGEASPLFKLTVEGGRICASGASFEGTVTSTENFGNSSIILNTTGQPSGKSFIGSRGINGGGGVGFVFSRGASYETALQVYTNVATAGNLVTGSLSTPGPYVASGGTSWTTSSDERLKDNITELPDDTLDIISNIHAVKFTWKNDTLNKKCIGFIAQNVQEYYPEVVNNSSTGYLGVDYTSMIPVLLKSIQQLKTKLDDALQRIQTLESK